MIVIIDYEVGNLGSIQNMLKKIGVKALISSSLQDIEQAEKLILPGVGSFDAGMTKLNQKEFLPLLNKKALQDKIPVLGICLGMQLMTNGSEEGQLKGLGWINASTTRFVFEGEDAKKLKIPNMGWNYVHQKKQSKLFNGMYADPKFYFVHSYYVKCQDPTDTLATANYGFDYDCAFERGNIYGVQFHPEKSHKFGMCLLKNFAEI